MERQRGKESNTPLFEEPEEIILRKYFIFFFPDVPDSYLLLRKEHAQVTNCMLHLDEPQSQSTRKHYQL